MLGILSLGGKGKEGAGETRSFVNRKHTGYELETIRNGGPVILVEVMGHRELSYTGWKG